MKSKRQDIDRLRENMKRFNEWELSYTKQLSEEERFGQFVELFDLAMESTPETIEKAHREHLEQLSRIAKAARGKGREKSSQNSKGKSQKGER